MTTTIIDAPVTQTNSTSIPKDIYLEFKDEAAKTQQATDTFDFFKLSQLVSKVKDQGNILHESLKKKSNIYIFGAGGTTSWFLPKLLKIYNDAFNKVPGLRYDLNIVLLDADQV